MALYSQKIKTRDLDPTSFVQNQSCQFKIPNDCSFYPNLRLVKLGSFAGGGAKYNHLAGVYASIRHIRLTSDGMVLSQMRFANAYLAFKALNDSNSNNNLVKSMIAKNAIGYDVKFQHGGGLESHKSHNQPVGEAGQEKKFGWLDLRTVLPILKNMGSLDTRVFKNCVLHIEYETDPNVLVMPSNHNNAGDSMAGVAQTVTKPILVMDEIEDMAVADRLKNQMKSIVWSEIEHDRANLPALPVQAPAGTKLRVDKSFKLNAFSGKTLGRVLFRKMTIALGTRRRLTGGLGSVALNGEVWNYRIDGAKVFPSDLDRKSQILKLLADTYGNLNIVPFGDREAVGLDYQDVNSIVDAGVPRQIGNKQGIEVGNLSYVGFGINQKVNDFQVDFSRNATSDNRGVNGSNNLGLEIHCYAEVRKSLVVNSDGSFVIAYV